MPRLKYRYVWNSGLDKATRISLKNRRCGLSEVDGIYHVLFDLYKMRMKSFKQVSLLVIGINIVMFLCNWFGIEDKCDFWLTYLPVALFMFAILLYVYLIWVTKERRQFLRYLAKGYPELVEKYKEMRFDRI